MIKKFEQYIKESLNLSSEFTFQDRFQAIFDTWENHIYITSYKNSSIDFNFEMPETLDDLDEFTAEVIQFRSDLTTVLETLNIDNIQFDLDILSSNVVYENGRSNPSMIIRIYIYQDFSFNTLEEKLKGRGCDLYYQVNNNNDNNWQYISDTQAIDKYKYLRLTIYSADTENSDLEESEINNIIYPMINGHYLLVNDEYIEEDGEYIYTLKKKTNG